MKWRRGEVALGVVAVAVAALCVRLGVWQLDRRLERRARNAELAARLALPPLRLDSGAAGAESAHQRRVIARGVYDYARERVWGGRSFQGTPGVALLTPLRLGGGVAVYVDRGWAPSPDAFHVDQGSFREPDTATVVGVALRAPRGRGDIDPQALGGPLPYEVLPVVIQLTAPAPVSAGRLPRRWPPPLPDDGPHLSYAIQWFAFALVALVGTAALLWKSSHARGLSP